MFTYPFRAGVLPWWLGLTVAMVLVQGFTGALGVRWLPRFEISPDASAIAFGVVGVLMEVFWWTMAFKIAVEGMRIAAEGTLEHDREIWVEDEQAARQVLLWGTAALVAYLLYKHLGGQALALYCLLLAALMPAISVLLGMEGSLRRAFDPSAWLALQRTSGSAYVLVAGKLTLLAVAFGIFHVKIFAQQPRWLGVPLSRLVLLYLLFASYHELGRMLDRHRGERRAPGQAPIVRPEVAVSEEEELSMRAADRYAAESRFAKAAQQLESLVCTPAASPAAHARYRELLGRAGDHAGLLQHARVYVPAFLAWGDERGALNPYQESLAMDPDFELQEAGSLGKLFTLVMADQQSQQAITLGLEYLRRFGNEPEAVSNGLATARLMDRLGRDEEARLLLVDLVRRFPGHPMRGELIAALETLEGVSRRGH